MKAFHLVFSFVSPSMSQVSSVALPLAIGAAIAVSNFGAKGAEAGAGKEEELLKLLNSNALPQDKAIACKELAVYGTEKAVPVLAPLLADESLASWARIPLEVIPGSAADEALRQAMGKLQGRLLVGTINSIGVRRDIKAITGLEAKVKDSNPDIACAAAVALGRVGGEQAATALKKSLAQAPEAVRSALAEGCLRCAEALLASGRQGDAIALYDAVHKAEVPKYRQLEAARLAMLALGAGALPTLVEQLHSPDKAVLGMALRTARELPGSKVTEALVTEMKAADPARQPLLLLALADRGDPVAQPAIIEVAKSGPKKVRLTAVTVLEHFGTAASLPVLFDLAADPDPDVSRAALAVLTRLPGTEVDSVVLEQLPKAQGKLRPVLIEVAGQRQLEAALPTIIASAEASEPQVRSAAIRTIGAIGGDKELGELIRLLRKTQDAQQRAEFESALVGISSRRGAGCAQPLLSLAQAEDNGLRIIALHGLASAGGADALNALKVGINDKDESVQDEAVRTLASWPNTWPDDASVAEPLLSLAKSGKKTAHQVLALRGYMQFVDGDKKLKDPEKWERINLAIPLLQRPEEKRLAISVIHDISTTDALNCLTRFTQDSSVSEDACLAILEVNKRNVRTISREARHNALKSVIENSSEASTKSRAEEALKRAT